MSQAPLKQPCMCLPGRGMWGTILGGVPRAQKMLKGHLPRVIYHQAYWHTKIVRRETGRDGGR